MDRFKHRGAVRWTLWARYLLFVCCIWQLGVAVHAQTQSNSTSNRNIPAPPLSDLPNVTLDLEEAQEKCVGVFLQYHVTGLPTKIPPHAINVSQQPYSFESAVTLTNLGYKELELWQLSIGFQYDEVIAKSYDVLFLDGTGPPGFQTTEDTRIVGVTSPNLLTSINTADDPTLIATSFNFTGTEFGINGTYPLPKNVTLTNPGYTCALSQSAIVPQSDLWYCCSENQSAINDTNAEGDFFPPQSGDIIMTYDVMSASVGSYTARVSILMNDPIGRIDNWNLTWQWTQGEFIQSMKGGQVSGGSDQDLCIYGVAAVQYPDTDFSQVMSCSPNPVIIDLDQYQSTNPDVAIPYCCRNGTLLPDLIDPTQSRSDFELTVMKLPPNLPLDEITPPSTWNIGEGYTCQQPLRVAPAKLTPTQLHSTSAVASWQVVCNSTVMPVDSPKTCCVSFSAYYNDSVIPCPTCSCGCPGTPPTFPWNGQTCNPNIDALLLPYQAIPCPPSNRTIQGIELAKLDHYKIPDQSTNPPQPLPCPDNCGVSINWHVYSNYDNGWSSRITLFNWDTQPVVNWSTAVQMPAAMPGFQSVYSFNGTLVPDVSEFNNTLFMQGHNSYDNFYLLGKDSNDLPGKLQSMLSFDKTKTPNINIAQGDGFPSKVWFNGEECRIAATFPTGDAWRVLPTVQFSIVIAVTIFLMAGENLRFL